MRFQKGKQGEESAADAFGEVRREARHDYGHSGYTGTVAEKESFVIICSAETFEIAEQIADELMTNNDTRIRKKWGPAGCITVGRGGYLFFGWASC